jgi:hypothetical protein
MILVLKKFAKESILKNKPKEKEPKVKIKILINKNKTLKIKLFFKERVNRTKARNF